jgi:predicted permease
VLQIAQVALSVILLFTAGLFVRSLWRVRSLDLGLEPDAVVTATVAFNDDDYRTSEGFQRAVAMSRVRSRNLLERIRHLPGAEHASVAIGTPFYSGYGVDVRMPGRDSLPPARGGGPYINAVGPDYFETVGTRLVRGRAFTAADHEGSPRVVIVNETMARTLWPNEDPVSKCLIIADGNACTPVVGMVRDARRWKLREDPAMQFYVPYGQENGIAGWMLLVRPHGDVESFAGALRAALVRFAPDARLIEVNTLASAIDPQIRPWRVGALMFGLFGVLALVVAAVGLFSVASYLVAQRTHELGVRIALGARPSQILRLVLGGALVRAAVGVATGAAFALAVGPLLQPFLFETVARDPLILGIVALALLSTTLLAGAVPSWRACRVDPALALRAD